MPPGTFKTTDPLVCGPQAAARCPALTPLPMLSPYSHLIRDPKATTKAQYAEQFSEILTSFVKNSMEKSAQKADEVPDADALSRLGLTGNSSNTGVGGGLGLLRRMAGKTKLDRQLGRTTS